MDKSQAYKALVERVKKRYSEYCADIKPTNADKQRSNNFAATFSDKEKFWKALQYRCVTWEKSTNKDLNDERAHESLTIAIANGFDPKDSVALFAPVVNGVNICNEINLYTYWQGFGYAERTPKIKYLLVAQDWGNFINDESEPFKAAVEKMNAGIDIPYPFSLKSTTDRNLIELFKVLGRDVTKSCADVFFTNFCLGYRIGNEGGGMTKKLMMRDADIFRELCNILEPENILCLGKLTSECVYEALTGEPSKNLYGEAKNFTELLDAHKCILVTCGEKTSQIYPLAHCGGMGTANRPLDKQKRDWKKVITDDIFRDALYVVHTNYSGYMSDYFLDSKGKAHNVPDDKKVKKFYDRLPDFSQRQGSEWTFFYQGMGNGYFVNNKVVDAYLAKTGIRNFGEEQPFEEDAALETIAELNKS